MARCRQNLARPWPNSNIGPTNIGNLAKLFTNLGPLFAKLAQSSAKFGRNRLGIGPAWVEWPDFDQNRVVSSAPAMLDPASRREVMLCTEAWNRLQSKSLGARSPRGTRLRACVLLRVRRMAGK